MATIGKLGAAVEAKLKEYARKIGNGSVSVGFLAGRAVYEDGTPVATVAFWNEFGTKGRAAGLQPSGEMLELRPDLEPERIGPIPPRPFFRTMIAKKSSRWANHLGKALIASKGDGSKALALMGEEISGALQQSIQRFTTPPLAASTIRRKGFSKPLIDTKKMIDDVAYRVD